MKMKKLLALLLCLILAAALLTGCGADSSGTKEYIYAADQAVAEEPMPNAIRTAGGVLTEESGSADLTTQAPESRKWIVTVNMDAETEDLDGVLAALNDLIAELNGYVEDQSIYNGSTYSSHRYRSASLTVRIPAQDVDRFTEDVEGIANVVSKNKSLEDVTLSYVDTQSRMEALETEEDRLLELLSQAETMADLLEIESRLTEVRYELDSVTSQLRTYDNQIDYATIYLGLEEVQEYTPTEEPTLWERIRDDFTDSLERLWESLQNLLVFVIAALPFLVVYGGIAVVLALVIRRLRKNRKAKKAAAKKPWSDPSQTPQKPEDPQ